MVEKAKTGKKLGCGPLAAILLVMVALFLVGSNAFVGYYHSHCAGYDLVDCLMGRLEDPDAEPEEGAVAATGTYTWKDYSVNITMNIPLGGGNVTGSVSGTCKGRVQGTYNGQNNGSISGKLSGACDPFFVNIPASADFSGTVNKSSKSVPITFNGRGGGISHQGSMTLTYR